MATVSVADHGELRRFFDRAFTPVYEYAVRLTGSGGRAVEEIVGEAFVRLARGWRDGRITCLEIDWPLAAVRQRALDDMRRRARAPGHIVGAASPSGAPQSDGSQSAIRLLARLPDRCRATLVLRYVDERPVPGIAAAMGISAHATELLLARARRQLLTLESEEEFGDG